MLGITLGTQRGIAAMRKRSAITPWLGVAVGAALLLGATACASGDDPETSPSHPSNSPTSTEPVPPSDGAADNDPAACDDGKFIDAASIPTQLSDLGIPFYPCAHEMTALTGADPVFVGEYVTNHETIIVEMAVTDQFDASDWEVTDRSVEGDMAITTAQKPGYSLVVAIGPTRASDTDSSLHYTLRAQ